MAAASHAWAFRASLRRNAFGWSGTRKAIERLNEAVGEIERVARTDPALAGEGAESTPRFFVTDGLGLQILDRSIPRIVRINRIEHFD